MNITIVGGWDTDDTKNKEWELELDNGKKDEFKEFRRSLGRSLAIKRQTVFVGSDDLWERVYDKAAVAFTESGLGGLEPTTNALKKAAAGGIPAGVVGGQIAAFPTHLERSVDVSRGRVNLRFAGDAPIDGSGP